MNVIIIVAFMSLMISKNAAAEYFHEPSVISIHPDALLNHSDFGFSMGFQYTRNNLVVGAPSVDMKGKVYSCDMSDANVRKNITCEENLINLPVCMRCKKNQHFYLGASIAATPNSFMTCAPMSTAIIGKVEESVGACFILDGAKTQTELKGTYEQYKKKSYNGNLNIAKSYVQSYTLTGGTGWAALADEDNDLYLISKPSQYGDIVYAPLNNYKVNSKSLFTWFKGIKPNDINQKVYNFGLGVAAGKFFSNDTVYAYSMLLKTMHGAVEFFAYNSVSKTLDVMNKDDERTIESKAVASMFGSALAATDLNMDGFADLIVAAPVYSDLDCVECGAVHIYLGGELATIKENAVINGEKQFGRFGSAIAAKDIDGDGIPELVVSAPYEDAGVGAVYIFSGYEMRDKLKTTEMYTLRQSDMKYTQRIQNEIFRTLGFSLQFIHDIDKNGCNELAVGSPGKGTAVLFKGIQSINVTLSCTLLGEQIVREQDKSFIMQVCANVEYPKLPSSINGNLTVKNTIIGAGAMITNPDIPVDFSCNNCPAKKVYCNNVTVNLEGTEPGDYKFTSNVEMNTNQILNNAEYNNTWVIVSPYYSRLKKSKEIARHCSGDDCIPKLSMNVSWSGRTPYPLLSSSLESVTILVRNDGNSSYGACVWLKVTGAPLSLVINGALENDYIYLKKPFKRDTNQSIILQLNMTKPTNNFELMVRVRLYENCNPDADIPDTAHKDFTVPFILPTDGVIVTGSSHSRNFTKLDLKREDTLPVKDDQEYVIWNKNNMLWQDVTAKVSMKKMFFVQKFTVYADKKPCTEAHTEDEFRLMCALNLKPNSTKKIIATTEILKADMRTLFKNNTMFNTISEIELLLQPTSSVKKALSTTDITFFKELPWAYNNWVIGVAAGVLALFIMIVIIIVLYKCGFFKRKQKQRLQVFRESVRTRNSRRDTHVSSVADAQGLNMDVAEDPFDPPVPINNDISVIPEETPQKAETEPPK